MPDGHSTVYRKTSASPKSYRKARAGLRINDYTKAINGADSHEAKLKLLAEKQRALHAGRPPRPSPDRPQEAEPGQIADPGLRRLFEQSKAKEPRREAEARQAEHEPVKKAARNGSYAHGMSMAATLSKVYMRQDITWRAKSVASVLSAHWPHIKPSKERLSHVDWSSAATKLFRACAQRVEGQGAC